MTRTIPVYWGPECVSDEFEPDGVIFFKTMEELEGVLTDLSFSKYQEMLDSAIKNQELALEKALNSPHGMYQRMTLEIGDNLLKNSKLLGPLGRSKPMAAARKLLSYL
jgi:hypothetical protein